MPNKVAKNHWSKTPEKNDRWRVVYREHALGQAGELVIAHNNSTTVVPLTTEQIKLLVMDMIRTACR
jgi:hypothetical protein